MPDAKRDRLEKQYGLPAREVDILARIGEGEESGLSGVEYFEEVAKEILPADAAKWIIHELLGHLSKHEISFSKCPVSPRDLAALITQVKEKRLTSV